MSEMRPGRRTMKLVDFVSRGEATLRSLRSLRRPRMGSVPRSEHALASSREFDRWGGARWFGGGAAYGNSFSLSGVCGRSTQSPLPRAARGRHGRHEGAGC